MSGSEALARRLVACPRFRWMLSMREREYGAICVRVYNGRPLAWADDGDTVCDDGEPELPDLEDPATLGCLLALVREAWGDGWITPVRVDSGAPYNAGRWTVYGDTRHMLAPYSDTEAEALVAALEAAP